MKFFWSLLFVLLTTASALAMSPEGCGSGSCSDCHSLSMEEASSLLKSAGIDKVKKVEFAEMPGVWEVDVEKGDKSFPLYIDFSKSYVVVGNIVRLKDKKVVGAPNKTTKIEKVDLSRIPLDDAILVGDPMAPDRVVVFTDPLCPFCLKLHNELKEVLRKDRNVSFLVKMFPLKMHGRQAYDLSRAVVCSGSPEILDQTFELAELRKRVEEHPAAPDAPRLKTEIETLEKGLMSHVCETPVVETTKDVAREVGIRSTPTLVFPDGRVLTGAKKADVILQMLGRQPEK